MPRLIDRWRPTQLIYLALLMSLLIYGGIAWFVTSQPRSHPSEAPPLTILIGVFSGVALVVLVATAIARSKLFPPLERVGDGRDLDLQAEDDGSAAPALVKLRVGLVVIWALCESIAALGLVLAVLAWDVRYFAPFGGVSLLAMLFYAPRTELLAAAIRGARRGAR